MVNIAVICEDFEKMTVDLNATLGPIIDSVVALMPSLVNLIVAIVPAVLAMAVIDLVTGIFGGIVGKLKI
jgi:hypothetical protein